MFFTIIGSALLGGIIGGAGGYALGAIVDWFIDDDTLTESIEEEYDDAFKLLIKEKKNNAVKVGIFNESNDLLDDVEIQSSSGVSNSLYKGKVIYV